jgi:Asp-tRNA(Asn)/Glu-tRNA(Gln) amidotransferase A subunit family amidase
MRTTFGSSVFASAPAATTDAVVVARLRAAGAIVVGKTNLPEFAAEGFTSNDLFGTTRNPWNAERTCGGSSGGSAVALATGMAAIATATDGGGSVRIPAAYCGLVGLKPTNGVIGRDPIPDWIDLSTDGPFSNSADDLEVLLDVLRGPTPGDPSTQQARPSDRDTTIGRVLSIERFTDFGPLPAEAAEPFAAASARFAEVVDRAIEPITPSDLFGERRIDDDWFTLCGVEHAYLFGRAWFDEHADELTPSVRYLFEGGFACPMEEYQAARRRRFEYVLALDELLGDDGLLVSPVMATDACPAAGWEEETGADPYVCAAQNITGHPALSVPAGFYPSGVPFGLQVTAPRFRDDLLLDVAKRWEQGQPWPLTAPGYEPFA